jgi:hypothetical protein
MITSGPGAIPGSWISTSIAPSTTSTSGHRSPGFLLTPLNLSLILGRRNRS